MATQIQIAGNGFGGVIQGNFGTYSMATDGSFTVDTRDVPPLLAQGMAYVKASNRSYTTVAAPAAASVGGVVTSGALSNGSVSVTANPDLMRQVNFEWGTGTTAITAGTATIVYKANDGTTQTDSISLACALSTAHTQALTKGVVTISSITIADLAGGTSPWRRLSTTASLSVPVDPGAVDVAFNREYDSGATVAVGTVSTSTLATIAPTNAPNATQTYSWNYYFIGTVS